MSFLTKFSKEIDGFKDKLGLGDDKKTQAVAADHTTGQAPDTQHGAPSQAQQYGAPQQQQYGGQQHGYGYPSQPQFGGQSSGPPGAPSLPPGWVAQWDQNSQRWYYLEQATGRTQWDMPQCHPQGPPGGYGYGAPHEASRDASHGGYPPQGAPYGGGAPFNGHGDGGYGAPGGDATMNMGDKKKEKSGSNMGGMMAAGAGGLLVGGLAGHALADDSSDDEQHRAAAAPAAGYGPSGGGYGDPYAAPPPNAPLPDETRSGSSVSGSDKEDVEDAREDYQEALASGSESDIAEAREEYQEEYEETYDD